MSVPSIPSRYLTPIVDISGDDPEGHDVCKMSRLVNDPSKIGPGSYFQKEQSSKNMPRTTQWSKMNTIKGIKFAQNASPSAVGPGSYNTLSVHTKKEIMNPTIPRSNPGVRTTFEVKPNASIKNDFETQGESGLVENPGPGAYRTEFSSFKAIPKKRNGSLQLFQSKVSRFNDSQNGS